MQRILFDLVPAHRLHKRYTEHQPNLDEKVEATKLKKGDEASLHPIVLSH